MFPVNMRGRDYPFSFGKVSWTVAERKLREYIIATGVDSVEAFNEVTGPLNHL